MLVDEKITSMRERLKAFNPAIGLPELSTFLVPIGYFANLEDQRYWTRAGNRANAINIIHGLGVPSIGDTGLVIARRGSEKFYLSSWVAYSLEFLEGLNKKENDDLDILTLAQKLDAKNKTQLIIENSNAGNYFFIPDKSGEMLKKLSSVRTPSRKDLLGDYSLFKIFGDDYKARPISPKELAEELLMRWATDVLLPALPKEMYENVWIDLKQLGKEAGEKLIQNTKEAIEGTIRHPYSI
jgi:hypothetical protein